MGRQIYNFYTQIRNIIMKILVTGATGFIGNYLIHDLLTNGYEVVASSTDINKAKLFSWFNKVSYIAYNINHDCDKNLFEKFGRPDRLIHLAWEGLPNYKALFHIEKNLSHNYQFLKNLVSNGLKDVTISGTCLEYGMVEGCLKENLISNPIISYAIAKDSLRKFLLLLQNYFPFNLKWVRIFYMYGEGQSENSLYSQLMMAIKNDAPFFNMSVGNQIRDFISVDDAANHLLKISTTHNRTDIINCCSGIPISVKGFVEELLKRENKQIILNLGYYPYIEYEPINFFGDKTKLNQIIYGSN